MQQHFVIFLSPGTFVSEETERPIGAWDTDKAVEMARSIRERHGAKPYGFMFTTRGRTEADLDSKEIVRSNLYYLGGRIETRDEVEARNDPREEILRSNMRINDIERVIVNENSWRFTAALGPTDVILDVDLRTHPDNATPPAQSPPPPQGNPATGSFKGALDHEEALERAGWVKATPPAQSPPPPETSTSQSSSATRP